MKRLNLGLGLVVAALLLVPPTRAAAAEYGIAEATATASTSQAGGHPDFTLSFELKTEEVEGKIVLPSTTRATSFELPPGLLGNPGAAEKCTMAQLVGTDPEIASTESGCPVDSQVGVASVQLRKNGQATSFLEPVYNMQPGLGEPARLGLFAEVYPVFVDTELRSRGAHPDYGATAKLEGISTFIPLLSADTTIWGVPAAKSHDPQRLTPYEAVHAGHPETPNSERASGLTPAPFTINPTRCAVAQEVRLTAIPYIEPEPGFEAHATAPLLANTGCRALRFEPDLELQPTTKSAESGSGLNVELTFPNEGTENPDLPVQAEQRRVEVTLPEGVTVNPSQAEGLGACTEAQFEAESAAGVPGEGCPENSKIGSVVAKSPLIEEPAEGSLYVARPYENPFDSLVAVYMVVRIPDRGVVVKLAGKVELDPDTGQLTSTFDEIPQVPVSSFQLHFREGPRSPLVTPSSCGTYSSTATFTAWSGQVVTTHPSFEVVHGVGGGACPSGVGALHPGLVAGTLNNAAGRYSPFYLQLTRQDGEPEITHFSAKLPRGLVAKLAGVAFCPNASISAAAARTGAHGGEEELEHPSCPAGSEIGHTLAGAGVGRVLAYAPGRVYLAGPYRGAKLSIAAITAAKIGPFDVGTVVVREPLRIDPETAEVLADGASAEPLPLILKGVPTRLRDLRAHMDRPNFVLNPTGCGRKSVAATVLGAGPDLPSNTTATAGAATVPFRAADCLALPFKPKLTLSLHGGAHRGAHPALKALLRMGRGEAGIARTQVTLPHSEFLENAHIKTVCTRVQFAEGAVPGTACPVGSIYGHAKAATPLLSEPLRGPVYLRSSNHELPDLVVALNNRRVSIDLVGRIDSLNGQIRTTFEATPDAPVSTVTLAMRGGKKGLLVNSTNICEGTHRALAKFTGQNGKKRHLSQPLAAKCGGAETAHAHGHRRR